MKQKIKDKMSKRQRTNQMKYGCVLCDRKVSYGTLICDNCKQAENKK